MYYDNTKSICLYFYAIIEYIEGENLTVYIKRNQTFPVEKVYNISQQCSYHLETYPFDKELFTYIHKFFHVLYCIYMS